MVESKEVAHFVAYDPADFAVFFLSDTQFLDLAIEDQDVGVDDLALEAVDLGEGRGRVGMSRVRRHSDVA